MKANIKIPCPRLGENRHLVLDNGIEISVSHTRVRGGINEYYCRAYRGGEKISETFAQYLANGGYPGGYSVVSGSRGEAWGHIKGWINSISLSRGTGNQ